MVREGDTVTVKGVRYVVLSRADAKPEESPNLAREQPDLVAMLALHRPKGWKTRMANLYKDGTIFIFL